MDLLGTARNKIGPSTNVEVRAEDCTVSAVVLEHCPRAVSILKAIVIDAAIVRIGHEARVFTNGIRLERRSSAERIGSRGRPARSGGLRGRSDGRDCRNDWGRSTVHGVDDRVDHDERFAVAATVKVVCFNRPDHGSCQSHGIDVLSLLFSGLIIVSKLVC